MTAGLFEPGQPDDRSESKSGVFSVMRLKITKTLNALTCFAIKFQVFLSFVLGLHMVTRLYSITTIHNFYILQLTKFV